jgi:hypothetical protein
MQHNALSQDIHSHSHASISVWYEALRKIAARIGILSFFIFSLSGSVFSDQITPSESVESFLNVRSAPSQDGRIVAKLSPGEEVELIRTVDDWYEVKLSDGGTGFVSRSWTTVIDEPMDQERTAQDTVEAVRETILARHVQTLSDSLKKLSDDIDSLTKYIGTLQVQYREQAPSHRNTILLVVAVLIAVVAAIISRVSARKPKVEKAPSAEGQQEGAEGSKFSRRSYFVVSTPRITQTRETVCSFHIDFINSGDHPATSFEANAYMIDVDFREATIYREFRFSTANPIGSQHDITFSEDDIYFTEECSPKFICIATEYVDHELKKRCKQDFTFQWEGVKNGRVFEDCQHVEKEKSEMVWIRIRELRWQKGSRLRDSHSS